MILADKWKDYAVLDAASGEKLEKWGEYTLIRPDPQVIWEGAKALPGWKRPNARYHRSAKGGGEWEFFDLPDEWEVAYEPLDLRVRLKPFKFKHTGLFPEQAANWEWFSSLIRGAVREGRSVSVLNLFAYTGGATLAAARAGASVTHVDAAKGMVGWARENAQISGLGEAPIRWIVDDCMKFVEREARRGKRYDAVIMDPPSYGRGPKGELWKIEETVHPLIRACAEILTGAPLFFLINAYTTGLQPGVLRYFLSTELESRFGGRVTAEEVGLPITGTAAAKKLQLVLPCGAAGRWER